MCIDSERGKLLIEKGEMGVEGGKSHCVRWAFFFSFFFLFKPRPWWGLCGAGVFGAEVLAGPCHRGEGIPMLLSPISPFLPAATLSSSDS